MKYNSIGEQLIAKAKEIDPSYKPDKFNDMSEAIDVILNNNGSGGGDIWLDITPYLSEGESEDTMSISQEGYNKIKQLVENNNLAGIKVDISYFPLVLNAGGEFAFSSISTTIYEEQYSSIHKTTVSIGADLKLTIEDKQQSLMILPSNLPSQQIPSIGGGGSQQNLTIGDGLKIENGALDVNRNGVFKTNTITISKSEISLDETNNKQINFNTTAQEKITNLFTLMNQNQNNIVFIKSVIKLSDGSNFIIYMDYHARSAINNENIQGIAISSAINNSFDLHLVSHVRWQSSADLTNYFSYIQEYEIVFCYF